MNVRPTILCPIDFSDASAGALRYAAAVASHFATRLIALTVEDPLFSEAIDLGTGVMWTPEACSEQMEKFAQRTFGPDSSTLTMIEYEVAIGKPAAEILRVARERSCELIVMSTHGLTGMRKLFFGSTTERVLRETTKPVLVTPPHDPGISRVEDLKGLIRRIVVPVDLTAASIYQTQVARGIADALSIPLILVHVIEPLKGPLTTRPHLASIETNRRAAAEEGLDELLATIPRRLHPEALVVYGDPAEEVVKVTRDRQAGLVVMGLHGSPLLGPRMGSVTYRLLCMTSALVLALPPKPGDRSTESPAQAGASTRISQ